LAARRKLSGIAQADLVEDDADVAGGFAAVLAEINSGRNGDRPAADNQHTPLSVGRFEKPPRYSGTAA
jgi:hypothetical protein